MSLNVILYLATVARSLGTAGDPAGLGSLGPSGFRASPERVLKMKVQLGADWNGARVATDGAEAPSAAASDFTDLGGGEKEEAPAQKQPKAPSYDFVVTDEDAGPVPLAFADATGAAGATPRQTSEYGPVETLARGPDSVFGGLLRSAKGFHDFLTEKPVLSLFIAMALWRLYVEVKHVSDEPWFIKTAPNEPISPRKSVFFQELKEDDVTEIPPNAELGAGAGGAALLAAAAAGGAPSDSADDEDMDREALEVPGVDTGNSCWYICCCCCMRRRKGSSSSSSSSEEAPFDLGAGSRRSMFFVDIEEDEDGEKKKRPSGEPEEKPPESPRKSLFFQDLPEDLEQEKKEQPEEKPKRKSIFDEQQPEEAKRKSIFDELPEDLEPEQPSGAALQDEAAPAPPGDA